MIMHAARKISLQHAKTETAAVFAVGKPSPSATLLSQDATEGSVQISVTAPMMNVFQHTVDQWLRALSQQTPEGSIDAELVAAQGISPLSGTVDELCSDLVLKNDLPNVDFQYWCGTAFHPIEDQEAKILAAELKACRAGAALNSLSTW